MTLCQGMMLYLVAGTFAIVIAFAGVPAAVNNGNRVHLLNGREPNAGVSIAPDLIVMIGIWCLGAWLVDKFWGREAAWYLVIGCSTLLLFLTIRGARKSNREYQQFLDENGFGDGDDNQNKRAQQDAAPNP